MIVVPDDLWEYSIALRNSGVTQKNINMLEQQAAVFLFGKDDAKKLMSYIGSQVKTETTQFGGTPGYTFGGKPRETYVVTDFGDLNEFVYGDGILFAGYKALLCVMICLNLLSQNRVQIARQNVTKQPNGSRQTNRREEADTVQALSFTAQNIIYAMQDYLCKKENNPIGICIRHFVQPTRYMTNASGKAPFNYALTMLYGWI